MRNQATILSLAAFLFVLSSLAHGAPPRFDPALRFRAVGVLRTGLQSEEFWPSMHAAEGLTAAGFGDAVIYALKPRLPDETDDQRRCGLAREQIRAGRDEPVQVMVAILNDPDSNGHIHACESLFKVNRIGDREAVQRMFRNDDPILRLMAAAALAKQGDEEAMAAIRELLDHAEVRPRRTAAWVLGQIGGQQDWEPIRKLAENATEPLAKSFYWNALAKLDAPGAREQVIDNLDHEDDAVRAYSCLTLGVCGEAEHLPLMKAMLDDASPDTGFRAAEAIVRITNRMLEHDEDEDGIPNAVETILGTVPNQAEPFEMIYEATAEPTREEGQDPEAQANTIRDLAACHAGGDRYVFRVRFFRPVSELRTVFHLYAHLDGNKDTGRGGEGWNRGVDVMYSFVDGEKDPRIFTEDSRVNKLMPVRGVVGGDAIWICDDIQPLVEENRARLELRTLIERYPYERNPVKKGHSTGPHTPALPLHPERQVPELDFPQTRNFNQLPPSYPLLHALRRDMHTVPLALDQAETSGVIEHYNGDVEVKDTPGRVRFTLPVAGDYRLAFYGNAANAGVTGLRVTLNGRPLGTVAAARTDRPGTLFFTDMLAMPPDSTVTFHTVPSAGPGRFGQIMLIKQTPALPEMAIENLQSAILPAKPGETTDRVAVAWTTTYPAECSIQVDLPGKQAQTFKEQVTSPQVVHRFFLPETDGADSARVTVRTIASDAHPAVEEAVTVPITWVLPTDPPRSTRISLSVPETAKAGRTGWPVTSGVPLEKGALFSPSACRVEDEQGQAVPAQFRCLARWPDHSIKLLLADFLADTALDRPLGYTLVTNVDPGETQGSGVSVTDDGRQITVTSDVLSLTVDRNGVDVLGTVRRADGSVALAPGNALVLTDSQGQTFRSTGPADMVRVEEDGPVRATLLMAGPLTAEGKATFMRYMLRLHVFAGQPFVKCDITLENAALEPEMNRFKSLTLALLPGNASGRADFGVGQGQTLLQDNDNRCLLDGAPSQTPRAPGYCALTEAGLTVAVKDFWQLYPKGFRLQPNALQVDLLPPLPENQYENDPDQDAVDRLQFWCDKGMYTLRTGVRVSTTVAIALDDTIEPATFADHTQNPLQALCTPEHYCDSGVFGPLTPRKDGHFSRYEENLDKAFKGFLERRESVREYGFMNYGDWFGERTWNWGNVEYDTQHALALNFLRTGRLDMLRRAEEAGAHNADIDTIHVASHPERVGQVYTHCLGHTGKYFDADFKGMGSGFANGPRSTGHTWSRGHVTLWALTGNERYRETGEKVAYFQGALAAKNPAIGTHRDGGWSLIGVTGAYQMTGDPFYLNAARVLVSRILEKQRPNGQWGHNIWECRDESPQPWGCKPFMTGVIMHALSMYDRIEPTPEVKDALVRAADYLWEHTYVKKDHGFVYAEAPRFMNRGGVWTLVLNGDGLARACAISGSKHHRELLQDALSHNHYRAGISSFGKTFTQGLCFTPYMLAELTNMGITDARPVEGMPQAKVNLREHIALPPGESLPIHPTCLNNGDEPLSCSVNVSWKDRHLVDGPRTSRWKANPGLTVGPPIIFKTPDEQTTTQVQVTVRCGDRKEKQTVTVEAVTPASRGERVAWVTTPDDHLATAAQTLGLSVDPLDTLDANHLAECKTVVLGAEAFNKHAAACDRDFPNLLRFVAQGGSLLVGQLNDADWNPAFLPFDLALTDEGDTAGPVIDPQHRIFSKVDTDQLNGVTSYDSIAYVAPEWNVLMTNKDGNPAILEAKIGQGRVMVIMPSFDRAVNDKAVQAQASKQLLSNIFAYMDVH